MPEFKKSGGFKMRSGNATPFKKMGSYSEGAKNLLKAVPNKEAYDRLSDVNKKGFDKAAKDAGLPMERKSPAKQKVDPDAPGTPGKPGYEPPVKRSDLDAKGKAIWDKQRLAKKNTPMQIEREKKKKSPNKQRVIKGGEGQDQNKIFNNKGQHIGNWVNGKKVMLSTKSKHGQLNDAQREFKTDIKLAQAKTKPKAKRK